MKDFLILPMWSCSFECHFVKHTLLTKNWSFVIPTMHTFRRDTCSFTEQGKTSCIRRPAELRVHVATVAATAQPYNQHAPCMQRLWRYFGARQLPIYRNGQGKHRRKHMGHLREPCCNRHTRLLRTLRKQRPTPPAGSKCDRCGRISKLYLDNCHVLLTFSGYLCQACNQGLGQLGDCEEGVDRALAYLNKSKCQRHHLTTRGNWAKSWEARVWST